MNIRTCFFIIVLMITNVTVLAQSGLLPLELQVRGGTSLLIAEETGYSAPAVTVELTSNPGRNIGMGLFFNTGSGKATWTDNGANMESAATHLSFGAHLRLASSRIARFRPFGQLRAGILKMSTTINGLDDTFVSRKMGLSFGLMTRLGKRVHLVFPEAGITIRSKGFSFEQQSNHIFGSSFPPLLTITGGLAFQIGARK